MTTSGGFHSSQSIWSESTEPSFVRFDGAPRRDRGDSTIVARGQNFVVEFAQLRAGSRLSRLDQVDEFFVIVSDQSRIAIHTPTTHVEVQGEALAILPAGRSEIEALEDVSFHRIFTSRARDLSARSVNADAYVTSNPDVAPLAPPVNRTHDVAVHSLSAIEVDTSRFGRAFRNDDLMVNFINPRHGPRDPAQLSPHSHDDFEQGSLVIAGEYIHHIRRPWSSDVKRWRADLHLSAGANSVVVIPPGDVHTSQAVGSGTNLLIDVFAPPRQDLMSRPGFVLNESAYAS